MYACAQVYGLSASDLSEISENAIINVNYLLSPLRDYYGLPYDGTPMHEFVLSGDRQASQGVKTMDLAKRLLDFGVHAPTMTPVSRLDEVRAVREMNVRYQFRFEG